MSPGLGPAGRRRPSTAARLADLLDPELDRADRQLVARLQDPLALDLLAVEERAVGAAQVLDQEHPVLLEELAMPAADLRRLDPELAIVVAAGRGDAVAELQGGRGAPATEDDELEIHGDPVLIRFVPGPGAWR